MKYKYVLSKDTDTGELLIKEYAELNKDIFSPVCESAYEVKRLEEVLPGGPGAVIARVRTLNFFPPSTFSEKISLGVTDLISAADQSAMLEVYCDDTEFLSKNLDGEEAFEEIEDEDDEPLDEFIDDEDLPDGFEDNDKSGRVKTTIDVEEDVLDDEEE